MKGYFRDELVKEFRVGEALCGHGFTHVSLDSEDVEAMLRDRPQTAEWLQETLFCRLIPKGFR